MEHDPKQKGTWTQKDTAKGQAGLLPRYATDGLTLSTITDVVWAQLLREQANTLFSEAMSQLHVLCGASLGSQELSRRIQESNCGVPRQLWPVCRTAARVAAHRS